MRIAMALILLCPALVPAQLVPAQSRDIAELFPSSTIAYAELRDPGALASALDSLVKGTPLEDGLKTLHDRRDANKDPRLFAGSPGLSMAVVAASPEMRSELRKIRGVAAGLIGLTPACEPKIAACILTGDSAVGLLARAYLANEATFRRIATIEGVGVYQSRAIPTAAYDLNTGKPLPFQPASATEGPCEPTFAYVPGIFIVASNTQAIHDILKRYLGQARDNLTSSPEFANFVRSRRPEGLSGYVRTDAWLQACEQSKKANKNLIDPTTLAYLKLVVNLKSIPLITGHINLRSDGVVVQLAGVGNSSMNSPWSHLLSGAIRADGFRLPTGEIAGHLTIALPERQKRTAAILAFVNAVLKAEGDVGQSADEWITELEQSTKRPLREQYLSGIRTLTLIVPTHPQLPKGVVPRPIVALQLEPDSRQTEWEQMIPPLFARILELNQVPQASSETIDGVKIWSLPLTYGALHYGSSGNRWVFGQDRKLVARCCIPPDVSVVGDAIAKSEPETITTAFGTIQWSGIVESTAFARLVPMGFQSLPGPIPFGGGFLPPGLLDPSPENSASSIKELKAMFQSLPPIVVVMRRRNEEQTLELRWEFGTLGPKGVMEKLIPILERFPGTDANQPHR